jgi:hypothetical protein
MSWHFSQALAVEYSAASCVDSEPSALSNGRRTQETCCAPDKTTDASNHSQSGTTCKPSMADRGLDWWMSSLAASRAKTSVPLAAVKESKASEAVCGHTWRELWVKFCRDTSSWKTHRCLWEEVLSASSVILPRWGMMQDGVLWERVTPALPTRETESGSLPTIRCFDRHGLVKNRTNAQAGAPGLSEVIGGIPNPTWGEWLMGWPLEWTNESSASATDKFRLWCESHGIPCGVAEGSNDPDQR